MSVATRLLIVVAVVLAGTAVPASTRGVPTPGTETLKDRLLGQIGNGGYDVERYDLELAYAPDRGWLSGTATITARATQDLSRLSLDYTGPAVSAVAVDGTPVAVDRRDRTGKLRVTPAAPILKGTRFAVAVSYAGTPRPEKTAGVEQGFVRNPTGASVTAEPLASRGWFPNNDVPADKATLSLQMTVPAGYEVAGNGTLRSRTTGPDGTTFLWVADEPMSTYLMTANIGRFRFYTSAGPGGLPILDAVAESLDKGGRPPDAISKLPRIIDLFSKLFGPYPFSTAGSTIVDDPAHAGTVLETQTRPTYVGVPSDITVAHETAHQWFGDAIGLRHWSDIWLNEGFATWAAWYYAAKEHGRPLSSRLREVLRYGKAAWRLAPTAPRSTSDLFAGPVYYRGAATLEALRHQIGDKRFRTLLRRWYAEHRRVPATTQQFTALAEEVAGRDLTPFFHAWLYGHDKPAKRFR